MGKKFATAALVAFASTAGAQGFPTLLEFDTFWNTTPGPFLAVGLYTDQSLGGIQRSIQPGSGNLLEIQRSNPYSTLDDWAAASFGTNRSFAAVHENTSITANVRADAISLWKDRFTLSGSGLTTFQTRVDGTLGPNAVPAGYTSAAVAFYQFGIYRVSDGLEMANAYMQDFQGQAQISAVVETWLDSTGRTQRQIVPLRSGTSTDFEISLPPYLAAGTYEIRSSLFVSADVNDAIHDSFADYAHTASFESATVPSGSTLSSASGLLVQTVPGTYGYAAITTPVPEPETLGLMIGGLGLLGWRLRTRRRLLPRRAARVSISADSLGTP